MKPVVVVRNLEARYHERVVLSDINFEVMAGEIFIILGSSGCGKSTLFKNMLNLHEPFAGFVNFFDQPFTERDEEERDTILKEIGVLFQNGALLNSYSVFDNLAIPLEQHANLPQNVIEKMIMTKLQLVELAQAAQLFPAQLSGGMRKRAALARALMLDPKLLFCDEPSAGLDPITSRNLDHLLLKLRSQLGMTIIIVTHEPASIHRIADRILFLEDGHIIFLGTLADAIQSTHPTLSSFFHDVTV